MSFLKGKTAIITGAGFAALSDGRCGSIGYGIATAYAKEGANLVITGRNVSKLEKAKAELSAMNDKYLRMIAEYDNFRKRSAKERENVYADAYSDVLEAILPVIDNLERALMFADGEALTEGVKMTLKQFEDSMTRLGVTAFGARGEDFDPNIHNAVMQVEDGELGESQVAEVLQKGYKKGDKVIRYAMVKVAN